MTANDPTDEDYDGFWKVMEGDPSRGGTFVFNQSVKARYPVTRATILTVFLFLVTHCSFSAPFVSAVTYPHNTRITDCTDCHTEDIYTEDCHELDGFCLIAKSVDDLCLHCHVKEECCRLGQDHQAQLFLGERSHPSNVDTRDVNPAYLPEILPIHDGRITCRTCHLHSRAEESDYKMLRLVKLEGDRVDWTILCEDCHKDK
jgi:hypothetical protein